MLTMEGLIAILSLAGTFFSIGYAIGCNVSGKKAKK